METIDKAAQAHMNEPHQLFTRSSCSFKAGVEFAQRWIPVEEEQPSTNENVLYKDSNGDEFIAFYTPELKKWTKYMPVGCPVECSNITHWRPIKYK